MTSSPKATPHEKGIDTRIAPDPFAAVLPALAALGAIASIASVNWVAQDKPVERTKPRRKAVVALRELESCCLGLNEIFKRYHKHPRLFAGEGGAAASPMKFGVHGPRVTPEAARQYQQLVNDVASMLVLATQNSFDVTSAIEDGEIEAPEHLFYAFGEAQERLNRLFAERATLKASVETGFALSGRLAHLVRELKNYRIE